VAAGLYHRRAIFGFFLGDELVWMGVTPHDLAAAADTIKKDFPGAIIWVNEAAGVLARGCNHYRVCHNVSEVIPASVSWISADRYWSSPPHKPGAHASSLRGIYEDRIFPRLLPHQRTLLVPGSFASERSKTCSAACFDKFMTQDALDYMQWAASEPRIVGFAPYHWNNCPNCKKTRNEIGVKEMNSTRLTWQMLGKRILEARRAENNSLEWYMSTHPDRYGGSSGGGGGVFPHTQVEPDGRQTLGSEGALSEVWQKVVGATGSVIDGVGTGMDGDMSGDGGRAGMDGDMSRDGGSSETGDVDVGDGDTGGSEDRAGEGEEVGDRDGEEEGAVGPGPGTTTETGDVDSSSGGGSGGGGGSAKVS
jgi:hypothetical protein